MIYLKSEKTIREVKNLKSDKTIKKEIVLTNEPIGIWHTSYGVMDYTFKVEYSKEKCKDSTDEITNSIPNFETFEDSILQFLANTLLYPRFAAINEIQGLVYYNLSFSARGKLEHITVTKSVHPALDKEGMRALKLFFSEHNFPYNCERSYCHIMPIAFVLGE